MLKAEPGLTVVCGGYSKMGTEAPYRFTLLVLSLLKVSLFIMCYEAGTWPSGHCILIPFYTQKIQMLQHLPVISISFWF